MQSWLPVVLTNVPESHSRHAWAQSTTESAREGRKHNDMRMRGKLGTHLLAERGREAPDGAAAACGLALAILLTIDASDTGMRVNN